MRILFLSHYFPPEVNAPASRTWEHCKQWVKSGHQVTVVTCAPNHPRGVVFPGYRNKFFQRESVDGIDVVRVWTFVTANEGFLKRTINYVSYMAAAILVAPFLPKTDVVLSTSPQFFNGLAGYFVSRLKRAPWVLEIRDLWPESIVAVGAIKNRWAIRVLEGLEMFAYRAADRIVPVTDAFKKYMVNKGIEARKIDVLKNGVDLRFYKPIEGSNSLAALLELDEKFVASYVGTHGMAHGLDVVLHAAKRLQHRTDIVFLLVGDGADRERLQALKEQLNVDNVVMLDQQPKEHMPMLWDLSDVSLVLLKKSDLFKTVIPSKIFESMAMKKPIVMGVEGEAQEIIEAAQSGICIEPGNAEALAGAVLALCDDAKRCSELGENGRKFVAKYYDRTVLAKSYEKVIELAVDPDKSQVTNPAL
jgi:glycosyltransferase involved in cell wall biosynthesis